MKRIAKEFFDVRPGEWAKTLSLALFFFLIIAVFWVLKPIKRGLMIDFYGEANAGFDLFGFVLSGAQTEQLGKVVNMVVAYFVVIGFTLLVRRLERQQVQGIALGLRRAEPLLRRRPLRMAAHVRIAKACNGAGKQFDFSGRRFQRMLLGIRAEVFEQHETLHGFRRFHIALLPEPVEIRHREPLLAPGPRHAVINLFQPLPFVLVFSEGGLHPQAGRQLLIDIKIIARLSLRRQRLVHGQHETVAG